MQKCSWKAIYSFYEGHTMELVTFATRVCKVLGVETMIGTLIAEPRVAVRLC